MRYFIKNKLEFCWLLLTLVFFSFHKFTRPANLILPAGVHLSVKDTIKGPSFQYYKGAITRGNTRKKELALVFTGDEFAEGGKLVKEVLAVQKIKASFFFTGKFYRNHDFTSLVKELAQAGHYLGPHSDEHLLYCDWKNRDSLLVTKEQFTNDLNRNMASMKNAGIDTSLVRYFIPPYEWYNDSIAEWTKLMNMQLINYTPGTLSAADYTYPGLPNYRTAPEIYQSIMDEEKTVEGLNGFILLVHIGTDKRRVDKFYNLLQQMIIELKNKGYRFKRIDELLK